MSKIVQFTMNGISDKLVNGMMNELEQDYFETIKRARTAIVMFYRTACSYCKRLRPVHEDFADEFESSVFFTTVNIDLVDEARIKNNILGVPLVIAFKKGMSVDSVEGLRSAEEYHKWIDQIRKGLRPMRLDHGQATKL